WANNQEETFDRSEMMKEMKNEYNPQDGRICISQVFSGDTISKMGNNLQAYLSGKKMFFASKIEPNDKIYKQYETLQLPLNLIQPKLLCDNLNGISRLGEKDGVLNDFFSYQDELMDLTKKESSLVEPVIS